MLRGAEADRDERFVKDLCERLHVPLIVRKEPVADYVREHHLSIEEAGREVRMRCFLETAVEWNISYICLAHQKNDIAETMLYRLSRGTGLAGLAGIPAVRALAEDVYLVRPLLFADREEIEAWLEGQGEDWCEDSSNTEDSYKRNVIRGEVLPLLSEKVNARTIDHLVQTAAWVSEIEGFLSYETNRVRREVVADLPEGYQISIPKLCALPEALRKHLLCDLLTELAGGKDMYAVHVNAVLALCEKETGSHVDLPMGVYAQRSYEELYLGRNSGEGAHLQEVQVEIPGVYELPEGKQLHLSVKPYNPAETFPEKACDLQLDYGKIKDVIFLRNARGEDVFVMDKEGHKKTMNRWWIDEKIPREARGQTPVLICEGETLAILGRRISERYRVSEQTREVLLVHVEER